MSRPAQRGSAGVYRIPAWMVCAGVTALGIGLSTTVWGGQAAVRELTQTGVVESACSQRVRCEVPSLHGSAATILELAPEGAAVRAGDLLVRLDAARILEELDKQKVVVAVAEDALRRAEVALKIAALAKAEYLEGTFPLQVAVVRHEIFLAEHQERTAAARLKTVPDAGGGKPVPHDLNDPQFAFEKARGELTLAKRRLEVLENFTRRRTESQLEADVETAESKFRAERASLVIERQRLDQIENGLKKCTVRASSAGVVTYEKPVSGPAATDPIEVGGQVREGQTVLRVDDLSRLQVRLSVAESRIAGIKEKTPAKLRADALPEMEFSGWVDFVSPAPEPSTWSSRDRKEYAVVLRIEAPPALRPGMSVTARLRVDAAP